jgi:glycosyltransferase involved in cell wall biosynthesis
MFATSTPTVAYSDPWHQSLPERFRTLARGKYRVAYFYETANNSTFRYRAYNMAQVLNEDTNGNFSASYFFLSDLHRSDEISDLADVLVICRSRYCHRINQLVTKFRIKKKRVLFDIDDLVFDPKYVHLIINTLGQDKDSSEIWDYWFSYISRMAETLRMCDGAITTNNYLAARITECFGIPTKVIPNFINKEQLHLSNELFRSKAGNDFKRDEQVLLGYFSGSPSHNLDYALIKPALEELMEGDERIELLVVGYIEPGIELQRFGNRVKREPFHDYVNLQRLISTVEFNLMPLQSNIFSNCKSELKYFEAAITGTVSIASPTYTYREAIQHGQNGYISYAHQWVSTVRQAVNSLDNYPFMARKAYEDAQRRYAWFNQRETILSALNID